MAEHTDKTLLEKLNTAFSKHEHYESYETSRDKKIDPHSFRLKHYAGDVTYNINGFLDKNKDTLFSDLIQALQTSSIELIQELFPDKLAVTAKKRPETAGSQFRTALNLLIEKLLSSNPHYIRCIKPNEQKKPFVLEEPRVRHQIKYLGLVENIRVRRAGFAFRQTYVRFLHRYRMICSETWPKFSGTEQQGTELVLQSLKISSEEYRFGKTKIFIRNPQTLFFLEETREKRIPYLVTAMQKTIRAYMALSKWKQRKAAIRITLFYRKYRARKWVHNVTVAFSNVAKDPKYGKNIAWPAHPSVLRSAAKYLRDIHARWRAHKMISSLSESDRSQMKQKILAHDVFQGKKPWDLRRKFEADYLEKDNNPSKDKYVIAMKLLFNKFGDTNVLFADYVNKINPKGKVQKRGIVITEKNIYKHDPKNYKVRKIGTPLAQVASVSASTTKDTFVIVHCNGDYRDLVLDLGITGSEKVSELVTVLVQSIQELSGKTLKVNFSDKIKYNNTRKKGSPGVESTLTFEGGTKGSLCVFRKGKNNENKVLFPS
eukprot:TRINITY_DN4791_c0_g3_i1.p1 TRINITY_DN4791_c0_g3~~TRINITY_DN4791_c0_g3_i1.p1  ORF type:complete len:565 (+),score=86.86 TRINITY_DN4791_c0_g3_i1:67-1695(+)